jgi:hypothetical protein
MRGTRAPAAGAEEGFSVGRNEIFQFREGCSAAAHIR